MIYLRKFPSNKDKSKQKRTGSYRSSNKYKPQKKRRWSYRYGYYNYVRLTVSAVAIYGLYIVGDSNLWRYIFAGLLVLYNNIKPIHLKPKTWNILDAMTLGVIISTFFLI